MYWNRLLLWKDGIDKPCSFQSHVGKVRSWPTTVLYWNSLLLEFSFNLFFLNVTSPQTVPIGRPVLEMKTKQKKVCASAARGIHLLPTWMGSEKGFNGVDIWIKALKMEALLSHRDQGKFEKPFQVEDMTRTKVQGENRASKISQTQNSKDLY